MNNQEELLTIISFTPFVSQFNKKALNILDDYKFMNPKFFSSDDINSKYNLPANSIWSLIEIKKNMLKAGKIELLILYNSDLNEINLYEYLKQHFNFERNDLIKHLENLKVDDIKLKEKYDFDINKIYDKIIGEINGKI